MIDLAGNPKINKFSKEVSILDKVLIISPHPDDDVIGMGGTLELMPNKQNVRILYMTNGDGGISSS
jgi:glucosamine-6-phosphate deaminase